MIVLNLVDQLIKLILKIKEETKKYFTWEFFNFSRVNILTVINIKNGFNNSIGCNLKKYRSSQRLAPFTSIQLLELMLKNKRNINNGITKFFIKKFHDEIENIIDKAKIVKLKCFEKKK